MSASIKEFTHVYPVSKTLCFELKPVGKTHQNIVAAKLLQEDKDRREAYSIVKRIIDDYHRKYIDDCLRTVVPDWCELYTAIKSLRTDDSKAAKEKLQKIQKGKRQQINDFLTKGPNAVKYKQLFGKELFSILLPEMMQSPGASYTAADLEAVKSFIGFTTYFTGFYDNRKNIYSSEEISTAIAYRLIHQNFPKFVTNYELYQAIRQKTPIVLDQAAVEAAEWLQGDDLDSIFAINAFNNLLIQSGITRFNNIIGCINKQSNLFCQQHKELDRAVLPKQMLPLYKQILSDQEKSVAYLLEEFSGDQEAIAAVKQFYEMLVATDFFAKVDTLLDNNEYYVWNLIYISQKELTDVSMRIFGHWDTLNKLLFHYKEISVGSAAAKKSNKDKIEKWLKRPQFSLSEINNAIQCGREILTEEDCSHKLADYFVAGKQLLTAAAEQVPAFAALAEQENTNLLSDENQASAIKNLLDNLQEILHFLKAFDVSYDVERDTDFYSQYEELYGQLQPLIPLYNQVRNYVTRKPYNDDKFKLNFRCPTLANGWDKNKERDNNAIMLFKDGKYYLGIMNSKNKPEADCLEESTEISGACFRKMNYKLLPGPNKMLPKVFFSQKGKETFNPSQNILDGYDQKRHIKGDSFDIHFLRDLIDFYKQALQQHEDWCQFKFTFSDTQSYTNISEFYKEVADQGYKVTFTKITADMIEQLVEEDKLYLFQIYNKDFAAGTSGRPNLHTLYWKALFDPDNLEKRIFKLNGEAELFYRPKSIDKIKQHEKGQNKVNRRENSGVPIPDDIYRELCLYANGRQNELADGCLSVPAQAYIDEARVRISPVTHDGLIKDKRFTEDKYQFHVPLTINYRAANSFDLNSKVMLFLKNNPQVNIIGIDRGERNLIYVTLIDRLGRIKLQKSYNVVNQMDYQAKLDQREKERDTARKSWQNVGKIKELKQGYLSQVIHEIVTLMVDNNAIVVMEDLNYGFKRGRFKIEKQVYQKFEKMLIDKLNYLVFKNYEQQEPGGTLNGLQLANKFESFEKMGKQCGFIFYIPAAYTSKIDPATGFVNLFDFSETETISGKKAFLERFNNICYDQNQDCFAFSFDYDKFKTYQTSYIAKWRVCTGGKRIVHKKENGKVITMDVYPSDIIKEQLAAYAVSYQNGNDLLPLLQQYKAEQPNNALFSALIASFKYSLQMRNSNSATGEDYIISPVCAADGKFFDSRLADATLPQDADANGAYHIALKGRYLLESIDNNLDAAGRIDYKQLKITHPEWLRYAQTKVYLDKE